LESLFLLLTHEELWVVCKVESLEILHFLENGYILHVGDSATCKRQMLNVLEGLSILVSSVEKNAPVARMSSELAVDDLEGGHRLGNRREIAALLCDRVELEPHGLDVGQRYNVVRNTLGVVDEVVDD